MVVVGAGLAGLTAARDAAAAGRAAVVLEARDRVGGRTVNADVGGGKVVEMGGQWIGPTQDRIAALAAELGVATFPTFYEGEHIAILDGVRHQHVEAFPALPTEVRADLVQALEKLDRLALDIDLDHPWDSADAARFDGETFATWLDENVRTPPARSLVAEVIEGLQTLPAEELSVLNVLFHIRTCTDLDTMLNVTDGAQQDRLAGGSQVVSQRMADELGASVLLGSPVRRITQSAGRVSVESETAMVEACRAVVALPPLLSARVSYDPPLPPLRARLLERMRPSSVIKVNIVYDRPFWRDEGLSGQVMEPGAPVSFALDNSPADGSPGIVAGFIEAAQSRRLRGAGKEERRRLALECLERWFGPRAAAPEQYLELDWSAEEWTGGCFKDHMPVRGWTTYGPVLRAPCGRIHWAGAETAVRWYGYMDGAVESGHRAASEALAALAGAP